MSKHIVRLAAASLTTLAIVGCVYDVDPARVAAPTDAAFTTAGFGAASQVAPMYAAEFVSTAASGYDLNDAGDVVGKSYQDPGCGPFCLPPQDIVLWRGGNRIVLPLVPGHTISYQFPTYLNNQGVIAGVAGIPGSTTHAAIWTPSGAGYAARNLGVFPGATSADVFGLDDSGRMVGWSTKGGAIPTFAVPFMWTQAGGFVDLAALGYPNEVPGGMSPGGKVVTSGGHWYQLGNLASVVPQPAPPPSFFGFGRGIINDNGDHTELRSNAGSRDELGDPECHATNQPATGGAFHL